jgi:diguanylate cyclase (GGDEF)-like protein/PAS domain S-box-containing protein
MSDLMTANPLPSGPAPAPTPAQRVAYCAGAAVLVVLSVLRLGAGTAALALGALGVLAVTALLLGANRTGVVGTKRWQFLAGGVWLVAVGAVLLTLTAAHRGPPRIWGEGFELAGVLTIGGAFAVLAHLRRDPESRTAFLDASVVGAAVVMVLWVALVAPLHPQSLPLAERFALAVQPVREGVLVAILTWIALVPGRRSRPLVLLGVGVMLLLGADLAQSIARTVDVTWPHVEQLLQAGAIALLGLAGLEATHALRSDDERAGSSRPEHASRSLLIGVALLMSPVAMVVGDLSTVDGMVIIGACAAVLAIGVVARFVSLVHENQRAHAATAASERRFRLLADSAPAGIFELGHGPSITYANAEGHRLLGPDVVGRSVDDLVRTVAEGSREDLRTAITAVTHGEASRAELRLDREHGGGWVAWQGVPVATVAPGAPLAFASALDITELKRAQEALARQATHDPLTGLPNRRLLIESLIVALEELGRGHRTGTVALMFVDLDGFKLVNDVMGHDAGDSLLKTAALRLRNAVRAHDMVARFGGDEFVVLMRHVADRGELHDVAQRILDSVSAPIDIGGAPAHVGASIGIATALGPDDDPDALVRNADAAMYKAKDHGRGRYEFFRPDANRVGHRML